MQKIVTYLWFNDQAEEAAKLYTSVFKNSRIKETVRDEIGIATGKGKVLVVEFQLEGQDFIALNGGPDFRFTEAISLLVNCETQQEVDALWAKLIADGGEESQCGWLKDRFGLSWQIIPTALNGYIFAKDPKKAKAATEEMFKMRKIDIDAVKRAHDQAA